MVIDTTWFKIAAEGNALPGIRIIRSYTRRYFWFRAFGWIGYVSIGPRSDRMGS